MAKYPHYLFLGIQRDVNPFTMQDGDLLESKNMYSYRYGAKKVRFGYTKILDNPDTSPIRNLIGVNFPNGTQGLIRISNKSTYHWGLSGSTWGSNINSWSVDKVTGNTIMAGKNGTYLHLSNGTDTYTTWNGTTFTVWSAGGVSPLSTVLTNVGGSVYGNDGLLLAFSAIDFDANVNNVIYATEPWYQDSTDPSSSGSISLSGGSGGDFVGLQVVSGNPFIYTQNKVFYFNGTGASEMPFLGTILPNTVTLNRSGIGSFLTADGAYTNTSGQLAPASFGIDTIIQDTILNYGITGQVGYSFGNYTMYYIGTMKFGNETYSNAMFVHDDQFDHYDIWCLGHDMTAFGTYFDPTYNRLVMVSGDVNGNVYRWGEEFSSDDGIAISYKMRTKYYDQEAPELSQRPDNFSISTDSAGESNISFAIDYKDEYEEIDFTKGFLSKVSIIERFGEFKTISMCISGTTKSERPEIQGVSIGIKDNASSDMLKQSRSGR